MILGYILSAQDNSAYFFEDVPDGILCPNCGTCRDYSWHPPKIWFSEKWRPKDAS